MLQKCHFNQSNKLDTNFWVCLSAIVCKQKFILNPRLWNVEWFAVASAAVSYFSIHMFMLWSDWSLAWENRFGYNFYKVEGFGVGIVVGFVVEWEWGGEVGCEMLVWDVHMDGKVWYCCSSLVTHLAKYSGNLKTHI